MTAPDWRALYRDGITPWEDGKPWKPLLPLISNLVPEGARILDVGCGVGTQALHLAEAGYDVSGVDIVESAVEAARSEAGRRDLKAAFVVRDFFTEDVGPPYDLVLDRSVLSNCEDHAKRLLFAERVTSVLHPGGWWINVTGCADNRTPDGGPDQRGYPRLSLGELVSACEPFFEIHSVSRAPFGESGENDFLAWVLLLQLRPDRSR